LFTLAPTAWMLGADIAATDSSSMAITHALELSSKSLALC